MIEFWLAAGLLLLVALAFLLIPVLRGRKAQAEEDRTALNVALYQERLAELQGQQAAGVLTAEQLQAGEAEAARELLADTEGVERPRESRLGKALPLLAAVLVPVLGLGLYLHFGASDIVELTHKLSLPPVSIEEMAHRLERAAAAQPDSLEDLCPIPEELLACAQKTTIINKTYFSCVEKGGEAVKEWVLNNRGSCAGLKYMLA